MLIKIPKNWNRNLLKLIWDPNSLLQEMSKINILLEFELATNLPNLHSASNCWLVKNRNLIVRLSEKDLPFSMQIHPSSCSEVKQQTLKLLEKNSIIYWNKLLLWLKDSFHRIYLPLSLIQ